MVQVSRARGRISERHRLAIGICTRLSLMETLICSGQKGREMAGMVTDYAMQMKYGSPCWLRPYLHDKYNLRHERRVTVGIRACTNIS